MNDIVSEHLKFLKSRQSFQERQMRKLQKSSPSAAAKHGESADGFAKIVRWFEDYLTNPPSAPISVSETTDTESLFSLNPLELDALPEEFRSEISISEGDIQDAQVVELFRIANRPLDLNEILIGCWRKFNVQHKRNQLTARLYRLVKRGQLHVVGKGTYALGPGPDASPDQEDDEQGQLL
ncbi:MAG: hypothetical protein HPY59_07695 [Anaerolineae bacterium]|nr:hypothetical protein [Anaerolineae bacterium]